MNRVFLKTVFIMVCAAALLSLAAPASAACRSSAGGYCFDMQTAQVYTGLEFLNITGPITPGELMNRIYIFGIGVVALSAFVMLVFAGVEYLTSGDNEGRLRTAKETIKNAFFGLALALISFLILNTINPDLVQTLDRALPPIQFPSASGGAPSGGTP